MKSPQEFLISTKTSTKEWEISKQIDKNFSNLRRISRLMTTLGTVPIIADINGKRTRYRTSGNFGIRLKNGFFITGTEVDKQNLAKRSLIYVESIDYSNQIIFCLGKVKPSREVFIHQQIYMNMPEINVVLHTHDNLILKTGGLPTTRKKSIGATLDEAKEIVELLKGSDAINIRKHGQVIVGRNCKEAMATLLRFHQKALIELKKEIYRYK
jgi:ribulose-5-phosphate 4-epimerase/fuculose-1-phosphate aldolase